MQDDRQTRPTSVTVSVRLPEPLLEELREIAAREYDTPSGRIRLLVREDVRQNLRNGGGE